MDKERTKDLIKIMKAFLEKAFFVKEFFGYSLTQKKMEVTLTNH